MKTLFLVVFFVVANIAYGQSAPADLAARTEDPLFRYSDNNLHGIWLPLPPTETLPHFDIKYKPLANYSDITFLNDMPIGWMDPQSPSAFSQKKIQKADGLYNAGKFKESANLYHSVLKKDPSNIVFEKYARSLYWLDDHRARACDLYKRLVADLDKLGVEEGSPPSITVSMWFPEAYWKLATCYLDEKEWDRAIYEISRTFIVMQSPQPALKAQALCYMAEAHFESGRLEWAEYYVQKGLEINPKESACLYYQKRLEGEKQTPILPSVINAIP